MKRYIGKLAALAFGLVLLVFSVIYQKPYAGSGTREWVRILSNSALVPGILLTGIGLLARISDEGFFDGIRYSMSTMLTHVRRREKKYDSFYDYMRREKKKSSNPLLLPGLLYLAAAVVLTVLYYFI